MKEIKFRAMVVEENNDVFTREIKERTTDDLPPGDLLIKVAFSSLNYKDALSASGNRGVTRKYPHTPGIDAAGVVAASDSPSFKEGDEVLVTGYDFGMNTAGGFGQYVRVPAQWAVKIPEGLSLKESMALGTAGLTAGLSVHRLSEIVAPADGKIIVSGATGGVGSISLGLLSRLGYETAAVTGKAEAAGYLKSLGASEIVLRSDFGGAEKRPMLKAGYAGGIDTVGGPVLENIIKSVQPRGAVTCCGNAASESLNLTVYPFILRGITLSGIDSQNCPMELRKKIWERFAAEWKLQQMTEMVTEIGLEEVSGIIELMLEGKIKGRYVIAHE